MQSWQVESVYDHGASHATMADSMEDAAFEALMDLHARHYENMKGDMF